MKIYHFLIMAGGTGGHIFPGLAVAEALRGQGHQVTWLGSESGMETTLVPKHGIALETVAIKGVRGNGLKRKLMLPFTLTKAVLAARSLIKMRKIDAVVGFGGFAAFPGGVAAKLCGLPIVIHEQNAVAGLVNKLLAKIATKVLYAFPKVFVNPEGLVGNPVRADIAALPEPKLRFQERTGALRLLVVGGSLGARILNETVPQALDLLKETQVFEVMHQSGKNSVDALKKRYLSAGVEANCVEFIENMPEVYGWADVIICRSGALTVAELATCGLGSILVPFPFAVDDHQTANAQYLVQVGAAILLPQTALTAVELAEQLKTLDREKCLTLAVTARKQALPDAAQKVADTVLATLEEKQNTL